MATMWSIYFVSFFMAVVLSMTRPAVALYGSELGMSAFEVGMLVAVYSLAPVLIAIRAGKAADRIGDRIVLVVGFLASGFGLALPYLFQNQFSLYWEQVLMGIGQVMVATSLQNLVGNSSTVETRDRSFAWFTTLVAGGFFVGPFLGGVIAQVQGQQMVFAVAAATSLIVGMACLWLTGEGVKKSTQEISLIASIKLLKHPPLRRALLAGSLIIFSRDIYQSYFPLYGIQIGLSSFDIGLIISLQGGSMFLARLLMPYAVKQWSRETVLLWSIFIAGLAFLVIPINLMTVTYLAAIAMGFGLGCGQPISMTETYNASPEGRSGEVLGLRMTALRLAQFVAPLFFGVIGGALGILAVFFVNGAFLLGGGYAIRRQRRSP